MALPEITHAFVYCSIALWALTHLGNLVCKTLLDFTKLTAAMETKRKAAEDKAAAEARAANRPLPAPSPIKEPQVGGVIGSFERLLLAAGLLSGSWEILAGVVALKTVARFKELDERLDAEYFLVGSLFSIAWTIIITAGWAAYDQTAGLDLSKTLIQAATALKGD